MYIVEDRFAISAQVHASEQDNLVFVCNDLMPPPRFWNITIYGNSSPSIKLAVINVEVVQRHVLDNREDAIISPTENN